MAEPAAQAGEGIPGEPPFSLLGSFERIAFRVMRWANLGSGARLGLFWQHYVLEPLFVLLIFRRLVVRGLERLDGVPRDAPVLLVANHRTFFDLFILGLILVRTWRRRWRPSFPVRANFFYENPAGLFICLLLSGGSMFPPFFRKTRSKAFNRYSLTIVLEKLRHPGNLVGFHPEGTRNKGGDPYQLLPAQPGAGEVALKARPVVVPAFINGLSNKLMHEVRANVRGRDPVIAVFGEPIDLSPFPAETRLTHHKRCSDLFCARIYALMDEEKQVRRDQSAPR
ncbi:MAG TPA: 1-acyl-sn-glycerol-3-phosphate acyltransferase [Myxococcales bacterium]|nr:1-acyl-sn-glycerol-3-phosphate acyltransferase [Myxococcales bacterium]